MNNRAVFRHPGIERRKVLTGPLHIFEHSSRNQKRDKSLRSSRRESGVKFPGNHG